jgi:Bacterial capsule synthesis protein PGA_cap
MRTLVLLTGVLIVGGLAAISAFRDEQPAASTQAAPAREPPADETVTIAAVGDIAMGRDGYLPPDDGAALFAQVHRLLRGDVVLGNLEQALTESGASKCGPNNPNCFAFRTPPSTARALASAGFTVMNLANNHSYDYGQPGQDDTVTALNEVGLEHTGLSGELPRVQERPVRVIVLGFGFYSTSESLLDIPRAKELVEQANRRADVVVVTFHGGAEGTEATQVPRGTETYLGEQRGNLRAFAHAVVAAGADLVIGHGPHVLRGMEWHQERLIAYSLGNFAGNHTFLTDGLYGVSGVLRVTLGSDGSWVKGTLSPTALVGDGIAVPDPTEAAHGLVRDLSRHDFGRKAIWVSQTGELSPPAPVALPIPR